MDIDAFDYVFPLCGGNVVTDIDKLVARQVYGTAFYLTNNIFITAGHVVENALKNGHDAIALGKKDKNQSLCQLYSIEAYEIFSDYDIALIKVNLPKPKAFPWDFNGLSMFTEVGTVGFPHGFDIEEYLLMIRALKGYVVSTLTSHQFSANPKCYELSFHCARGISGAPLFQTTANMKISGVVLGNSSIEIPVFSSKEVMSDSKEVIYEKYETTSFGIAVTTGSLRDVKSEILGSTIFEYLRDAKLAE